MGRMFGAVRIRKAVFQGRNGYAIESKAAGTEEWGLASFYFAKKDDYGNYFTNAEIIDQLNDMIALGYKYECCRSENEW